MRGLCIDSGADLPVGTRRDLGSRISGPRGAKQSFVILARPICFCIVFQAGGNYDVGVASDRRSRGGHAFR
ncbi:MAG: hypothetical protein EDS66_13390 [Planctomycetota bacterium]|nr:MAG: hypothetical protein EDS66_13390 [Planctomycetota bacterium]MCQ3921700.1 hypothetical protein [Planctomycetota bacterium]